MSKISPEMQALQKEFNDLLDAEKMSTVDELQVLQLLQDDLIGLDEEMQIITMKSWIKVYRADIAERALAGS